MMEAQDTVLTVRTQLEINRSIFEPKHYTLLRAFYEQVVAAGAEQVVLKQTGTADDDTEEGGYR
jgi:hypothetical protein